MIAWTQRLSSTSEEVGGFSSCDWCFIVHECAFVVKGKLQTASLEPRNPLEMIIYNIVMTMHDNDNNF